MSIKGYHPYDDLEYARADDNAREKLPNKKFKMNQGDGYPPEYPSSSRSKKSRKRKKRGYADKRSKDHKTRR